MTGSKESERQRKKEDSILNISFGEFVCIFPYISKSTVLLFR